MSIEFRKEPSPEEEIAQAMIISRQEGRYLQDKSWAQQAKNPDALSEPLSDASVNLRLSEVYLETSSALEEVLLTHKRKVQRAMSPFLKEFSDEQVDEIIKKREQEEHDFISRPPISYPPEIQ